MEPEPEKNQGRYNLRRRKDDGDAKPAEAKPEQLEEKDAKLAAAAPLSTPLDFGGKMGRLQDGRVLELQRNYIRMGFFLIKHQKSVKYGSFLISYMQKCVTVVQCVLFFR